jgi:trehalose utilization protein
MVNNSINIQIPLTVSLQINEHKKSSQMLMEIHVLVWDRHKNVPGVNYN